MLRSARNALLCLIFSLLIGLAAHGVDWLVGWAQIASRWTMLHLGIAALVFPPLAFVVSSLIADRLCPASRGAGLPTLIASGHPAASSAMQTMAGLRPSLVRIGLMLLIIVSGAVSGRTGPTISLGGGIMGALQRWMPQHTALLFSAGAAAALAGAFGAPLAGFVFALEAMPWWRGQRHGVMWGVLAASAALPAGAVGIWLGSAVDFHPMMQAWHGGRDWAAIGGTGLAVGLASGLFARILRTANRRPMRQPLLLALCCGTLVSICVGLSGGAISGTGSVELTSMLHGTALPDRYVVLKYAATLMLAIARLPGGTIYPMMAVGGFVGQTMAGLWHAPDIAPLVLIGAAAGFAGLVQAPLTAVALAFGFVWQIDLLPPLLLACVAARLASGLVCSPGLFQSLAASLPTLPGASHEP